MMPVQITPELEALVQEILSEGVFQDEAEVLREALRLLQKRQQLLRDVNAGVAQLDQGRFSEYDEDSLEQFLNDVRVVGRQPTSKNNDS